MAQTPLMSPKEIRGQLKLPRKTHEKIILEQEEATKMKRQVMVLERVEARYKFESEERKRLAAKAQAVREAKQASRNVAEKLRLDEEMRLKQMRKNVEDKKKATRNRLKKPPKEPPPSALDKFRRGGAVAVAATAKTFLTSFHAIESGEIRDSSVSAMQLHKKTAEEEKLQREARKCKAAADLQTFTNLEPALRDKAATEKRLKETRQRVLETSHRFGALDPPHSPLLTRRALSSKME